MRLLLTATLLAALPAWAQYAGPAVLSRGEAPAAIAAPQIRFQPYAEVTGVYDSGLAGVSIVDNQGNLADASAGGVQVAFGLSGSHEWRHSRIGLGYRGSITHYNRASYYDGLNQSFLLSFNHQFSPHASFSIQQTAGLFSRDFGLVGLQQTVTYDPNTASIPTTDFFDNRTVYTTTHAGFVMQRSTRLSISFGGDASYILRRSSALTDSRAYLATGDVQYRVSRRTTLGGMYNFTHMSFSNVFGGTDAHGVAASYSIRISRLVEFSGYAGVMRIESTVIQSVPIDPVISALLGTSQSTQLVHTLTYGPNVNARVSRALRNGVVFASGSRGLTAGNGLFMASQVTSVGAGYAYTGLRRWSANAQFVYGRGEAFGSIAGTYGNITGGVTISRNLRHSAHLVAGYQARQYSSPTYTHYNRFVNEARIGVAFSPGETPLRLW
jgi:hypothetical protein